MTGPLMPKATALWLIDHTTLTFEQISRFCQLHVLEVQGIADGDVAAGVAARNPVVSGEVEQAEIERCQQDPTADLQANPNLSVEDETRRTGPRYTPVARRQDRPDAVSWLLRHHPELSDFQIGRLVGTTKGTIDKIRNREHWNSPNITPRDPVLLDLCTRAELVAAVEKARQSKRWREREQAREEEERSKPSEETPDPMRLQALVQPQAGPSE